MFPQVPLDILINILSCLPPRRDRRDTTALTLVACFQASTLLREAASVSSLWKPHYQTRYEHCDKERERGRMESLSQDWRLMYFQRRQIDCTTMRYLDDLVEKREKRQALATSIVDFSMDVWDVLELECSCPIPPLFAKEEVDLDGEKIPDHAITRRHWAKALLDTVSRAHAIKTWRKFWAPSDIDSFEETITVVSCFFGASDKRITAQLEALARKCRRVLEDKGILLDCLHTGFDLVILCREICYFMKREGFITSNAGEYGLLDNFPHAYLTTHKRAIPLSFVHIFTAISTRLGLDTSPVNFPGTVVAHVRPPRDGDQPVIVNPSASVPEEIASELANANPVPSTFVMFFPSAQLLRENLVPCGNAVMLLRASRNILACLTSVRGTPLSVAYPATLFSLCCNFLFQADDRTLTSFMTHIKLQPIDCTFLLAALSPVLLPRCDRILRLHCDEILAQEAASGIERRRSIIGARFFVGMPFAHVRYGYIGFIWGWDPTCAATEEWILSMKVDSLRNSRNQPFYSAYATDGSHRYVAEENMEPASFTKEDFQAVYNTIPEFGLHFENVELAVDPEKGTGSVEGRGRLLPSPHSRHSYPEDEVAGALWVKHGLLT